LQPRNGACCRLEPHLEFDRFPAFPSFFPPVSQPELHTAGKEKNMQKQIEITSVRNPIHSHPLPGKYKAQLQHIDCDLELGLDQSGCLSGSFLADGEHLEITGGVPSVFGEVYGVIRERISLETVAVFRAVPHIRQLILEIDTPNANNVMELGNAERIVFERFDAEGVVL
jgi:hypothetical protein